LARLKKIIKFLFIGFSFYCLINFITPFNSYLKNRSIENQIEYIQSKFEKGEDNVLQRRFPEGKVFGNALFALSIIEYQNNSTVTEKNTRYIDRAINELLSPASKSTFPENLNPPYGSFYNGWVNFVLKSYIESSGFNESAIQKLVLEQHSILTNNLVEAQSDSLRLLESYHGSSWPADNLVAIASLPIEHDSLRKEWYNLLLSQSDDADTLIHHVTGQEAKVRGASQALMIYLTHSFDPEKAIEQNAHFNDRYVDSPLRISLVREFPRGDKSGSDLDSGPLIFGYGSSASIMNIKTQASLHNSTAKYSYGFYNMISMPYNLLGKKYHLFKKEIMFDIFMLWGAVEI